MSRTLLAIAVLVASVAGCTAPGPLGGPRDLTVHEPPPNAVWLDQLDLSLTEQEWGQPRIGQSVGEKPLTLGGRIYAHGLGTHATSELHIDLYGVATALLADIGVDDETKQHGSVVFTAWVDGAERFRSPVLRGGAAPQRVRLDLRGAQRLVLVVEDAGDGIDNDHADWAGALLLLRSDAAARPAAVRRAPDPAPALAVGDPPEPQVHAPRITGATPGRPFLFRIPATGTPPLGFAAGPLPPGLTLDPDTGIITGRLAQAGRWAVPVTVTNPVGQATYTLTIVGGYDALALTPPMGWNSWNVWGTSVDDAKVRAAAEWMVRSGLAAHGYAYINIDDAWEGERDAEGRIQPNEKFPDMAALADYVHSLGLKLGIYSSPGPKTCANYEGSYEHEELDAQQWAAWGIDLVKYDWCSYGSIVKGRSDRLTLRHPYDVMRAALDGVDRDIVYSLCQYGMGNVWEWGAEVGGNYWRTTGDIVDTWASLSDIGFRQDVAAPYAGPGHWNDPDMLVVGQVGWGPNLHPTRLTPHEQITHITLWSLLAAPLLVGCDLSQLDAFTLAILTNPEVLEVDQDPLGRAARRVRVDGRTEVWARPLADGSVAVGLFNRGIQAADVTMRWTDLGLHGPQRVRDLWTRSEVGVHAEGYTVNVARHGAAMIRTWPAAQQKFAK